MAGNCDVKTVDYDVKTITIPKEQMPQAPRILKQSLSIKKNGEGFETGGSVNLHWSDNSYYIHVAGKRSQGVSAAVTFCSCSCSNNEKQEVISGIKKVTANNQYAISLPKGVEVLSVSYQDNVTNDQLRNVGLLQGGISVFEGPVVLLKLSDGSGRLVQTQTPKITVCMPAVLPEVSSGPKPRGGIYDETFPPCPAPQK